ncbi:MAG UNVERIFIED_CONTAM: hypothetical protein LVQ98_02180 [Rickettsiaceae bacterium]|jgi:tRNA A37 N6-isopentenylltransferase MiaA
MNGEIINIDSMQVYKELPILTCSPSSEDKNIIPHHLYNHISIFEGYSVSKYIEEALVTDIMHNRQRQDANIGRWHRYVY